MDSLSNCRCISDSLSGDVSGVSGIFGFQLLAYVGDNLVEGDNPQLVVEVEALGGTLEEELPPLLQHMFVLYNNLIVLHLLVAAEPQELERCLVFVAQGLVQLVDDVI